MPSIIGGIPDKEVAPVIRYLQRVRKEMPDVDYNEALVCLLLARYQDEL